MAVTFPYVRAAVWSDGSTTDTAAKRNTIEDGIFNAHQQPAVRVFHNTTQSIPNSTNTALLFNSERYDQAGGSASTQHDTVTNNSRLTCRYAGIYVITGHLAFASNGTGIRLAFVQLNGATSIANGTAESAAADGFGRTSVTTQYSLAVNDYVELLALQSSGGALNTLVDPNNGPEFMMVRVA